MRAVCAQIVQSRSERLPLHPIAINLSARQLQQPDLGERIERTLREYRVEPALIELEITESVLMRNAEDVVGTLRGLRAIGVRLSIDDFGTGYSSLAYLRMFPLDSLKIDRSFIKDVARNADAALIVRAIISMAHNLRLKVVAEGVETESQVSFLARSSCDEIQGYYFARPADAEASTRLLSERRRMDMPSASDSTGTPAVLVLADEQELGSMLSPLLLESDCRILTAASATEAFDALAGSRVAAIVADEKISDMSGVDFLSRVKELYPETLRVLLCARSDEPATVDAIDRGSVHKVLGKPWNDDELLGAVREALVVQFLIGSPRHAGTSGYALALSSAPLE